MGQVRRRWTFVLAIGVSLCACKSERTVYDEYGHVVNTELPSGQERDFADYMEKEFNASFSEKKNAQGVPQAVSNKVSSFQSKLDDSKRIDKEYVTSSYVGGGESALSGRSYAESGKSFGSKRSYAGGDKRLDRDLNPAFATASKGIFGADDMYAEATEQASLSGRKSSMGGEYYIKKSPYFSRDSESGYIETRRGKTPPPPVISSDEYMGRTIEETRTLLGRDDFSKD